MKLDCGLGCAGAGAGARPVCGSWILTADKVDFFGVNR